MNGFSRNSGKERRIFICSLFFLIGGLIGSISGNFLSQDSSLHIKDGLEVILGGGEPNLTSILLDNFLLPIASLFLATSVIGWFIAPLITLTRGYLLGWIVSSAVKTAGMEIGIYIYYGLPALVTVPCLIYITATSIHISKGISDVISQRRRSPPQTAYSGGGGRPIAACLILLFISSVAQAYLLPALIKLF